MNLAVNVHNLTKQYGDIVAVDSISFSINQGEIFEIFGFLGSNGAGKTTTIHILTGRPKGLSLMAHLCKMFNMGNLNQRFESTWARHD